MIFEQVARLVNFKNMPGLSGKSVLAQIRALLLQGWQRSSAGCLAGLAQL
jgi:hypothetical protein